ncbi:FHA domain-containing protein [Teredinibacter sp. KSP-S5-2]|uniref:FHA domain-containing protein n=1 Tax=Teredinibacter sp. KSP-S5-2 TaxID=3034506 RepID=UPI0029351261|nr:FHA domain-containing protein [Teredinibacter sp. KSP-S5-2]WNO10342.1 FHA domain-containing protein [Teredinibacter sp. KSP-S5-2]
MTVEETRVVTRDLSVKRTLMVLRSLHSGERYPLAGEKLVGQDPSCAIVLASPNISPVHAKLCFTEEHHGLVLEDLNSETGTWVNGQRIQKKVLVTLGDDITFGDVSFRLTSDQAGDAEATRVVEPPFTPQPSLEESTRIMPRRAPREPISQRIANTGVEGDEHATALLSEGERRRVQNLNEQYQKELNIGSGPRLIVMSAPTRGQVFSLESRRSNRSWTIGRDEKAQISIPVDSISRQHASITKKGDTYFIAALSSANPIVLNGEVVPTSPLYDGDKLLLGRIELTFRLDSSKPRQSTKPEGLIKYARRYQWGLIAALVALVLALVFIF